MWWVEQVPAFQSALDEIAAMADVGVELRERAILTSEKWRDLNPPPRPAAQPPQIPYLPSASRDDSSHQPALPTIRAFSTQKQPARRPKEKARKQDAYVEIGAPMSKRSNARLLW